jgi:class 3 adenylate cyclase
VHPARQPRYAWLIRSCPPAGSTVSRGVNSRQFYPTAEASSINLAVRLERFSSGEDVIISDAVRDNPDVSALLSDSDAGFSVEPFHSTLKGFDDAEFRLWKVRPR